MFKVLFQLHYSAFCRNIPSQITFTIFFTIVSNSSLQTIVSNEATQIKFAMVNYSRFSEALAISKFIIHLSLQKAKLKKLTNKF